MTKVKIMKHRFARPGATDAASFSFDFRQAAALSAHFRSKRRKGHQKSVELHGKRSSTPAALVVEDEVIVRLHIADIVEGAGFTAVKAFNADEAIELLMLRSDIRVVITDVNMPGPMDGLKLAHAVRNRWPPVEIIVMSGKSRPNDDDLPARGMLFNKPVDEGLLRQALRNIQT
jgi:CheY-like chemotaxis protein